MKKSKNERKKAFIKRIKRVENTESTSKEKIAKDETVVETADNIINATKQALDKESPSKISERIIMKQLRGHIGKKYTDEDLER